MSEVAMTNKEYFTAQLWRQNQVLVAVLGICSSLGVTSRLPLALTMGLSVTFVTAFSCLFVSLLRNKTPDSVRMITQLAFISLFTIIIDQFLQAYYYQMSKVLSVYVGLIITNCILMGRTEGCAKSVPVWPAFLDGVGAGLGYTIVLGIISCIREVMGYGEFFGYRVVPLSWYATPEHPQLYQNFNLMGTPPAGFFLIGILICMMHVINERRKRV